MKKIVLRSPSLSDASMFLAAITQSKSFHQPWIVPPVSLQEYQEYMARISQENQKAYFICTEDGHIAGVFNISEIVRGYFQSAYLGFYGMSNFVGQGYMSAGLKLVLAKVFMDLKLHRIEANIQSQNLNSIHLVKANGFTQEGFSPRYLMVNGVWRDHERWAINYEDWKKSNID